MSENDSHLSQGGRAAEPNGPVPQHHRLAKGDKVNGMSNPNGAKPDTSDRLAGQTKNY